MKLIKYMELRRKQMNGLGRVSEDCRGVECEKCNKLYELKEDECIQMVEISNPERAIELVEKVERKWAKGCYVVLGETMEEASKYVKVLVDEGLIEYQKTVNSKGGTESIKTILNKIKRAKRSKHDTTR